MGKINPGSSFIVGCNLYSERPTCIKNIIFELQYVSIIRVVTVKTGASLTLFSPLARFQKWQDLSAFDRLNTAIWLFNVDDHQFWWANKAALKFWEVSSLDEFLKIDLSSDSQMVRDRLDNIFKSASNGNSVEENWTLYPSGTPKMIISTFTPVIVGENKRALLLEVSEQRTEGLDIRAKRILEAVRHTPLMISTFGMDGLLLAQNPAAAKTYTALSEKSVRLENRYEDEQLVAYILQMTPMDPHCSKDVHVRTINGDCWHNVTVEIGRDPISGDQVVVLTEEDISERVQAQEELSQLNLNLEQRVLDRTRMLTLARKEAEAANDSKSTFLATMSHELRTPLNAIIGFSEMLTHNIYGAMNEKQTSVLNDIHKSGKHLLSQINELLDASTIESGELNLFEEEFETASVIEYCKSIFDLETAKKAQKLVVSDCSEKLILNADKYRLTQVLSNLLSNAVKYTPEGGQINFSIYQNDQFDLVFEVQDNGIGIAEQKLASVCDAFTQLNIKSAETSGKGVGLGLYIASQLVELHGGHLTMDSVENVGTTVCAVFPQSRLGASSKQEEILSD